MFLLLQEQSVYAKDCANKWWCGYDRQDAVVLDDWRAAHFTFTFLLRLFDRYPMQVEFKGGNQAFVAKRIYVTTPKHPEQSWVSEAIEEQFGQLMRRVDVIIKFSADAPKIVVEKGALPFAFGNQVRDEDANSVVVPVDDVSVLSDLSE